MNQQQTLGQEMRKYVRQS